MPKWHTKKSSSSRNRCHGKAAHSLGSISSVETGRRRVLVLFRVVVGCLPAVGWSAFRDKAIKLPVIYNSCRGVRFGYKERRTSQLPNKFEREKVQWVAAAGYGSAQPPLMVPPDGDGTNVSETAEPALAAGGRNIALLYLYFACFIPCSPSKFISQARPPTVVMY